MTRRIKSNEWRGTLIVVLFAWQTESLNVFMNWWKLYTDSIVFVCHSFAEIGFTFYPSENRSKRLRKRYYYFLCWLGNKAGFLQKTHEKRSLCQNELYIMADVFLRIRLAFKAMVVWKELLKRIWKKIFNFRCIVIGWTFLSIIRFTGKVWFLLRSSLRLYWAISWHI